MQGYYFYLPVTHYFLNCVFSKHMRHNGILIIFLILTGLSLLMDWYVFAGLKTLTGEWA
jgi:ABC-type uncharacterized transport system permease subunit